MSLLEVHDLSYRYGDFLAVKSLQLTIERGSIFGFLGPNGAGKTTTISCIAGLLSGWTGSMLFDGQPFRPATITSDRRRLGLVPQELAIYETLTGRENVDFFARLHAIEPSQRDRLVDRALELAGLTDRADDRACTYSGGMKRRLNLCIGQVHTPELMLLDEPTAGVDPQSRAHIFEALQALRTAGCTLLYTTHYMEEAQRLCDHVAIINDGTVIAVGSQQELAANIGDPEANLETVFLNLTGRSLRDA